MDFDPNKLEEKEIEIPPQFRDFIPDHWEVYGTRKDRVKLLKELCRSNEKWEEIESDISCTSRGLLVKRIWTIQNPYTYVPYAKTAKKYENWYDEPKRHYLFHGTQGENVKSIIEKNFDLRRVGTTASYYEAGEGVYFTDQASYAAAAAARWAANEDQRQRHPFFMFYCEVLIDKIKYVDDPESVRHGPPARPGHEEEVDKLREERKNVPRSLLYDTTSKEGKDYFVKFCDREREYYPYYPTHLIMYERH